MKQGNEHTADVLNPETTAMVCATDTLALGVSKYLRQHNPFDPQLPVVTRCITLLLFSIIVNSITERKRL